MQASSTFQGQGQLIKSSILSAQLLIPCVIVLEGYIFKSFIIFLAQNIFDDFIDKADKMEKGISNFASVVVNFLITIAESLTVTTKGRKDFLGLSGSWWKRHDGLGGCPWQTS